MALLCTVVRLFDVTTPANVVTTTESEKVFTYTSPDTVDPQAITVEFHNGHMYFSNFDNQANGIRRVDLSGYVTGTPITSFTDVVVRNGPGYIGYGFAFVQNDRLFTTDTQGGWGNWKLTWVDASPSSPVVDVGTFVDAQSDTSWYGQIDFDDTALPSTPSISTAQRQSGSTLELTFTTPSDATGDTTYPWYAVGSDSSTLSGECASSPCTITSLTAGITYTFQIRQSWRRGSTDIGALLEVVECRRVHTTHYRSSVDIPHRWWKSINHRAVQHGFCVVVTESKVGALVPMRARFVRLT